MVVVKSLYTGGFRELMKDFTAFLAWMALVEMW
jgi:hypothetical protein